MYPLRFIPVSSKFFGPPKGYYFSVHDMTKAAPEGELGQVVFLSEQETFERKPPISNSPLIINYFNRLRQAKIDESYVALLKSGRYWGVNSACITTADDKIIWLLSPTNYTFKLNFHQAFSRIKLPPVKSYNRVICLVTESIQNNYYHWMIDFVTRLWFLEKAGVDRRDSWYIINHRNLPFQLQTFQAAGISTDRIINPNRYTHIEGETLIAPAQASSFYGQSHSKEALAYVRTLFLKDQSKVLPFRRLFISRDKSSRRIVNEVELFNKLQTFGFEKFFLEDFTVQEQAALFQSAEMVVSFHGAGLTNIIFCDPGTVVLEIMSPDYIHAYFWILCEELKLRYFCYCDEDAYQGVKGFSFQKSVQLNLNVVKCFEYIQSVLQNLG
ncbi:glycosyltransferase family 61 protein [Anthocerotibacter panamensis]|uniref:glycosyltransferase family 61 protein n=1 Tax=Anthocerotibacter panamensis TaxID=2857077 RepID=UPI001C40244C|nr:glycosyltransferase family 61 protein [Anthocerotibacter panamensis]